VISPVPMSSASARLTASWISGCDTSKNII
jgi:hypothetical protein